MALLFALRGTSTTPRYAAGYKTKTNWLAGSTVGSPPAVVGGFSDPSVFGGSAIDVTHIGDTHTLVFSAIKNWVRDTRTFRIILRLVPNFATGLPPFIMRPLRISNFSNPMLGRGGIDLEFQENGKLFMVGVSAYDGGPAIFGATYDPVFTFEQNKGRDIEISSDGARLYISQEGVEMVNVALTNTGTYNLLNDVLAGNIWLGCYPNNFYINELLIFDDYQNHVHAARTDFYACADYEGANPTPPAANVIKQSVTVLGVEGTYRGAGFWETAGAEVLRSGVSRLQDGATITGSYKGAGFWDTVPSAKVESAYNYLADGVTLTGALVAGTDPETTDVRAGVSWINGLGVTVTGSLNVPQEYTGPSSLVNFAQIKENLRFIFNEANTTTADFDLSSGIGTKRVKKIVSKHPGRLPMQPAEYPYVAVYVDSKDIDLTTIAGSQKNGKRSHKLAFKVVGGVWNAKIPDKKLDAADDACEKLMENIEEVLRRNPTLAGVCLWQVPSGVTYHNKAMDEEANLRIGILSLEIMVMT